MTPTQQMWLPRALVESVLVVISILLALTLDEWREDQEVHELIDRSVANFVHEIGQNKSRIEDVNVYHRGVASVLEAQSNGSDTNPMEFRNLMGSLQPIALTSSAWDTAVATGALGRMEFELVSALTLTYNTQLRFDDRYRSMLQTLLTPDSLSPDNIGLTVHNASRFVAEITQAEAELNEYYAQTLAILERVMPEPEEDDD